MPKRKNPRDAQCQHCKRFFTKKGLKEHQRHVKCSPNSKATPREWERARCKHCGKSFHSSNSLRVHVSTQHPGKYRKSPNSAKAHRSPLKRSASPKSGRSSSAPRHDTSSPERPKRGASPEAASRNPGGRHISASGADKLQSDHVDVETMIRRSSDPVFSRQIWEKVLRQQQRRNDKTQSARRHAAP